MGEGAKFLGYERLAAAATIVGVEPCALPDGTGEGHWVVLDATPFYAESGGQVGDCGWLEGEGVRLEVLDVQHRAVGGAREIAHLCRGELAAQRGQVLARVDAPRRRDIARNHTAIHMMAAALAEQLGAEPKQAGSLVCAEYLRFDFHAPRKLEADDLAAIEERVNGLIMANQPVAKSEVPKTEALARGVHVEHPEDYGDIVRLVEVGEFSRELCGGTHVDATGEIGSFRITQEVAMAKGIRRLHGVTGRGALALAREEAAILGALRGQFRCGSGEILPRIEQSRAEKTQLAQDLGLARAELAAAAAAKLVARARTTPAGFPAIVEELATTDDGELARMVDALARALPQAVVVLGARQGTEKVALIAAAGETARAAGFQAGELVRLAAQACGGRGGGRAERAQAGGREPARLPAALEAVRAALGLVHDH